MRYRLVMHQTDRRWLELPPDEMWGNLDFGMELPEGARIHSIVPAVTELDDPQGRERVMEWAVFIAIPLEELELELEATADESRTFAGIGRGAEL